MENIKQFVDIIKVIEAMVATKGKSITVDELDKEFKKFAGFPIPYKNYCFKDLNAMLLSLPNIVQVQGEGPTALLTHVSVVAEKKKKRDKKKRQKQRRSIREQEKEMNTACVSQSVQQSHENPAPRAVSDVSVVAEKKRDKKKRQKRRRSIREQEKEMNTACVSQSVQQSHENPAPRAVSDLLDMAASGKLQQQLPTSVKPESLLTTVVVSVVSPNNINVHLTCQMKMLVQLANEMEAFYSSLDSNSCWHLQADAAKEGLYCAVKYRDAWFRGMIAGPLIEHRVEVLLVDYAHTSYFALNDIRHMRKKEALLPVQTFRVSLAHVKPLEGEWNDKATRFLEEAMCNKALHMYVVDLNQEVPNVVCIDRKNIYVNNELVRGNLAKWAHAV